LEQVNVRGMNCRGLRLELVAGLGLALAIPALAVAAENAQGMATQTTLATTTRVLGGVTQATVSVTVQGADGLAATGAVTIEDRGQPLAGVALDEQGQAKAILSLPAGDHTLTAVYAGDAAHRSSQSNSTDAQAATTGTPSFLVTVSPATLSLTAGQTGAVTATVTPVNAGSLTAPMFVTLSCSSGLPDESSCTPFPETVEIQASTSTAPTSTLTFVTQTAGTAGQLRNPLGSVRPIAYALIIPGALGLAGIAWGAHRRRWLSRFSLIALLGLITMLGTTGCNPRYNYLNHGPDVNPATPAGNYTVTISAQSSNGVTAITQTTSVAFTVK
jgi:hypothetical protein